MNIDELECKKQQRKASNLEDKISTKTMELMLKIRTMELNKNILEGKKNLSNSVIKLYNMAKTENKSVSESYQIAYKLYKSL